MRRTVLKAVDSQVKTLSRYSGSCLSVEMSLRVCQACCLSTKRFVCALTNTIKTWWRHLLVPGWPTYDWLLWSATVAHEKAVLFVSVSINHSICIFVPMIVKPMLMDADQSQQKVGVRSTGQYQQYTNISFLNSQTLVEVCAFDKCIGSIRACKPQNGSQPPWFLQQVCRQTMCNWNKTESQLMCKASHFGQHCACTVVQASVLHGLSKCCYTWCALSDSESYENMLDFVVTSHMTYSVTTSRQHAFVLSGYSCRNGRC